MMLLFDLVMGNFFYLMLVLYVLYIDHYHFHGVEIVSKNHSYF